MDLANNLQELRRKKGLTQEELAEVLGVSRQAVSKWELGEGYPEVEKLVALAKALGVSVDRLLGYEGPAGDDDQKEARAEGPFENAPSRSITITSPTEGVVASVSKVMRSQEFRGGKNSPKYALFAYGGNSDALWGGQNTFLGWYRDLESVTDELDAIKDAIETGKSTYTLRYSVKCKVGLFGTKIDG